MYMYMHKITKVVMAQSMIKYPDIRGVIGNIGASLWLHYLFSSIPCCFNCKAKHDENALLFIYSVFFSRMFAVL